jgi:acyl-CoA reductase-like NAD-dependent aldehyde dehydrogenase
MEAAATNLTPVILELGGKDPFIVLGDAEFDHAVEVALRGVFINQGQNCLAAERIYVERSIYDRFCKEIIPKVKALRQGPPPHSVQLSNDKSCVDCGAMTMPGQVEIVAELVQDALEKGAVAAVGGCRKNDLLDGQLYYPPTVLINVDHSMKIVNEEAFGPVMVIIPFENDEELIAMANSSKYGLGCSIFSRNYKRAEAISKRIVSGMCTINDFGLSYLVQSLPFGGCKVCFS